MNIKIRNSQIFDADAILKLYKKVLKHSANLARNTNEIDIQYIRYFLEKCTNSGIAIQLFDEDRNQIVGEMHGFQPIPQVFHHVLNDCTCVIDPDIQGQGFGAMLLRAFIESAESTGFHRIELFVMESNTKAIALYQRFQFKREGLFRKRIRLSENQYINDIAMSRNSNALECY